MTAGPAIHTPDQRLRVFVSSTLGELAPERRAVRRAIERLRLSPVMFELGARPHPPRELYRAYLAQSHVFVGIYWQRYGWVAPGETMSGLEDEYRLAGELPQLVYVKQPAPEREAALTALLADVKSGDRTSYRRFEKTDELETLVSEDLAVLLSERFEAAGTRTGVPGGHRSPPPVPLTPTIGRDADVAEVGRLLDGGVRLITLTGAGGVGKTRLALEVARVVGDRYHGALHYVPLAAVAEPSLVMATIADHLGVRAASAGSPLDAVASHVAPARTVLLLDNLEHVIDARDELAELLGRAPLLQILATSRQALRIRGEHEVIVRPLAVPTVDAGVHEVGRAPAVEMFVDRARAMGRPFALTADNAADVAAVCRRLEGVPLSLELAAARLRLLDPAALLGRLGDVLELRAAGSDLPERQQTLRATLDWSYALLDDPERTLFARLGVFAGGATLEAIESVCADDDGDTAGELLDTLAGLLDKSLLVAGDDSQGVEPRLRMLEPVREYARERLDECGGAPRLRRRHLAYFADLGRRAQPFLCGPHQREWAARFDAERANLRVAVASAFALGEVDTVLRLVWDTLVYYYIRDAVEEPREWTLAVGAHRDALDETQRALLDVALVIVGESPPVDGGTNVLGRSGAQLHRRGLALEFAVAQHYLGLHLWQQGDAPAAITALETSSQQYAVLDHDWGVAAVEMTLGAVRAATGLLERGVAHHRRALERARRIDNHPQIAQALQGLALLDARGGRLAQAAAALGEAAQIVDAEHLLTGATYCLEALAAVAAEAGAEPSAARALATARTTRERLGIPEWTAIADVAEPVLDAVRDALGPDAFADEWRAGSHADPFTSLATGLGRLTLTTSTGAEA